MTLELKPLGNSCNLACSYCYQEPMRKAGNARTSKKYDLELMMDIADKRNEANGTEYVYTLFGGEALLLPIKDLEILFKRSFEKYNSASIQTNGSLITDKHIALFKKYNVNVGISIDGPNDLNNPRVPASKTQKVEDLTSSTMKNIQKLLNEGIIPGIIITLHRFNATKEKLPRLMNFMKWIQDIGIKGAIIHLLEIDSEYSRGHNTLTIDENIYALTELAKFCKKNGYENFNPFKEFRTSLKGEAATNCTFNNCDPMNTQAVFGIEGNGQISNCGMVNKEGIEWTKANDTNFMRSLITYQTPQELGGCKDCPFFMMCNSYCPGSAIDGDWRNKTEHCKILKSMFKHYEEELVEEGITPVSKHPKRKQMEQIYINHMMNGRKKPFQEILQNMK